MPASWDDYIDSHQYWIVPTAACATPSRLIAPISRPTAPPVPLGLVHEDFQVANVLLGNDGNDVLIDWELAHIGDPRRTSGGA
jgi:thiamine kinase-like enzyme